MMRLSNKTAKTHRFDVMNKEDGSERSMSLFDYFQEKYNVRIDNWHLPLVEAQKDTFYPMEMCYMEAGQRYPYKLNEIQVQPCLLRWTRESD